MEKIKYVFVYRFLRTGGTENLILKLALQLKKRSYDLCCVCETCSFETHEIFTQNKIAIEEIEWRQIRNYCFSVLMDRELRIITFEWQTFLEFFLADGMGKRTFLYVVHPECIKGEVCDNRNDNYHKDLVIYSKSEIGMFLNQLCKTGHIAVMDNIIKSEMEEFYDLKFEFPIIRICVDLLDDWTVICSYIQKRYNGKKIVVAARADFPFKGYILGLLQWANKKQNMLDFYIEIVSYGAQFNEIITAYEKLDAYVKEKIHLHEELTYEELRTVLFDAYVFVGMGTSVLDAAEIGVPVIPVKPNEYDVMCNGRFDTNPYEVCAGDIYPYRSFDVLLQEIAQMDFSEYFEISKNSFDYVRLIYSSESIATELVNAINECDEDVVLEKKNVLQFEKKGIENFRGIIKNSCDGRKIVIYGAGVGGRDVFVELNRMGIQPYCFADMNYENYDTLYGIPVVSPISLDIKEHFVIVSLKKEFLDITNYLKNRGFVRGIDYIYPHLDLVKGDRKV